MFHQFQVPDIEIPAEVQTRLRRIFASKAIPGGQPADLFISEPDRSHRLEVWSDALWTGVQAVYRIAVAEERKKTQRLRGLANLDQALRIIRKDVQADPTIPAEQKELEIGRRAYKLGVAQAELKARLVPGE